MVRLQSQTDSSLSTWALILQRICCIIWFMYVMTVVDTTEQAVNVFLVLPILCQVIDGLWICKVTIFMELLHGICIANNADVALLPSDDFTYIQLMHYIMTYCNGIDSHILQCRDVKPWVLTMQEQYETLQGSFSVTYWERTRAPMHSVLSALPEIVLEYLHMNTLSLAVRPYGW